MATGQKTDYTTLENLKDALALLGVVFPTPAGGGVPDDGSVTDIKVAANAAIAYSKLNLTGSILSADLAGNIARSKIANGTAFAWVINSAGGALSEIAPTIGRVIYADGNGLPTGSAVTQSQLESALGGRADPVTVTSQTVVNVPLPTNAEQSRIDIRFVPSQDDVMFDALVSQDGSTYENSNAQYGYSGHIMNGTATVLGYDTPASDRIRMQYDNGSAGAGVGNATFEGIWGSVYIQDRGVNGLRWPTIAWRLSYRNTLSQHRVSFGMGARQNGERISHVRFQFENAGAFSGQYSVSPILSV